MTNNITDLLIMMIGDIPKYLHLALQQHSSGKDVTQTPPKQSSVGVCLPLRINLLRHPGNRIISSAEMKQSFSFTPHEAQIIETNATHHHLSKEDALKELIKQSLQDHEQLREITRQARRKPSKQTQVEIEVELWGPMSWNEKRTDNTTA